jgi:hypothetical protein
MSWFPCDCLKQRRGRFSVEIDARDRGLGASNMTFSVSCTLRIAGAKVIEDMGETTGRSR